MKAAPDLDWDSWKPVLKLALWLIPAAMAAFGSESAERAASGELKATESEAVEKARLQDVLASEYQNMHEMIRYTYGHAAACDTALEMYRGPEDFMKVVQECHSEGAIE